MARFDVFVLRIGGQPQYALDVQADRLSDLPTRVMIPLAPQAELRAAILDLIPIFKIAGRAYGMKTYDPIVVPARLARRPVFSFADRQDDITRAIDILFGGY